jgi:hypothetical protein
MKNKPQTVIQGFVARARGLFRNAEARVFAAEMTEVAPRGAAAN